VTPFEKRLAKFPVQGFTEDPIDPANPPAAIHAGGPGAVPHVVRMGDLPVGITHKSVARMLIAGDEAHRLLCCVLDALEDAVRAQGDSEVTARLVELLSAIPTLQHHVARTMRALEIPEKETTH
jgi:hypothetical protein